MDGLEESGESAASGDASEDTPGALDVSTAKRPAVRRRGRAAHRKRGRRLRTQGALALIGVLLMASVAASLMASDWQTFNPINGIGVLGQTPLQPQDFGDSAALRSGASSTTPNGINDWPTSSVAGISGQTHPPTVAPTATTGQPGSSGSSSSNSSYTTSYTGSWSGGEGQGCPGGGAPRPRSNVIYSAASYGRATSNMVALTFDDGPTPFTSPPILSFLEKTHTPATFFVMGQYARAYPWLVQREAADGFAIGVLNWDHPDMELLSPAARAYQLGATIPQLHADLGPNFCAWLWRPPYGAVNAGIVQQAGGFGLTTINWNDDPADWSRPGTMVIVQRVLAQVHPGSIILMHDGPAAREQTAAALPYILAGLQARGLVPVTIPTLLGSQSAPTGPITTPTPLPTATATASPTASPSPTATDTPTASTGGSTASSASISALDVWRWGATLIEAPPGFSGG
jgi:peptidoglycan/xylan/chitin deacetylase (PgdA/CDA1 family)